MAQLSISMTVCQVVNLSANVAIIDKGEINRLFYTQEVTTMLRAGIVLGILGVIVMNPGAALAIAATATAAAVVKK